MRLVGKILYPSESRRAVLAREARKEILANRSRATGRRARDRFWLTYADELARCPACASPDLVLLEALSIPSNPDRRRVTFVTGCHGCGLLFANPLPSAEHLQQYYSDEGSWVAQRAERLGRIERAYRRLKGRKPRPKVGRPRKHPEVLLEAVEPWVPVADPPPAARVLDFGCGDGKLLNRLQDRGWDTYGIEPSTEVPFYRHGRLDAPPQDASFDFVILHHVLEHVSAPLDILRQLAGSLREGGVLLVSVPRLDTLPQHRDLRYCIDGRRHLMSFSERCLTGLLARAGLTVAAHLDLPELDASRTKGLPMRLRLVAKKTSTPPSLPAAPLEPALHALRDYSRARGPLTRLAGVVPVRMRGAFVDWHRERSRPHRAQR